MSNSDIRASFLVFPSWSQIFWTWFTGRALPNQSPIIRMSPIQYTTVVILFFATIELLNIYIIEYVKIDLFMKFLILGSLAIVLTGQSRVLMSTIVHQCIHGRISKNNHVNKVLSNIITLLIITQTPDDYKSDHYSKHHKHGIFTTKLDPSAIFLMKLGFKRGKSYRSLWRTLILQCLSPSYHVAFFIYRLRSNLTAQSKLRRIIISAYILAIIIFTIFYMNNSYYVLFWCFILPIIIGYQISVLLEFITEHAWLEGSDLATSTKMLAFQASHCWGRFCGARVPLKEASLFSWLVWIITMIFYHLPVRLAVLPGDLPQHDFHHRNPNSWEWPVSAYAREADVLRHSTDLHYSEIWGLHRAIHRVFVSLAIDPGPSHGNKELLSSCDSAA